MKETRILMGMPITLEVAEQLVTQEDLEQVFAYFISVDARFSTYKDTSEISRINRGELLPAQYSKDMQTILALSDQTRQETNGYFDIRHNGVLDPSGIVKGWAIQHAAQLLQARGFRNFYIDAGGDIQIVGTKAGEPWKVGIRNPFNRAEYVKIVAFTNHGVATSGTAVRGQHIYNPHHPDEPILDVINITVIGPDVYEADRFATAAFAMGATGIQFIADLANFEGYMIDAQAKATFTSGLKKYVVDP